MKKVLTALISATLLLTPISTTYAEEIFKGYTIESIDLENRYIVGANGSYLVYYEEKTVPNASYEKTIRYYGMCNESKTIDTGAVYNFIDPYSEGLAAVYQYDDFANLIVGYVDTNLKLTIKPQFGVTDYFVPDAFKNYSGTLRSDAPKFSNGLALVRYKDKLCYINKLGKISITTKYEKASAFADGMAKVGFKDSKNPNSKILYGYIDTKGKEVIKPKYEYANDFGNGVAITSENLRTSAINVLSKTGKVLFNLQAKQILGQNIKVFSDGLLCVNGDSGTQGYIDTKGKLVIDYKFITAKPFVNGLAAVQMMKDGLSTIGYINKKGEVAIKPVSNEAIENMMSYTDDFSDGYQVFSTNELQKGLMDKTGRIILEPVFEGIANLGNGKWLVKYNASENRLIPIIKYAIIRAK